MELNDEQIFSKKEQISSGLNGHEVSSIGEPWQFWCFVWIVWTTRHPLWSTLAREMCMASDRKFEISFCPSFGHSCHWWDSPDWVSELLSAVFVIRNYWNCKVILLKKRKLLTVQICRNENKKDPKMQWISHWSTYHWRIPSMIYPFAVFNIQIQKTGKSN